MIAIILFFSASSFTIGFFVGAINEQRFFKPIVEWYETRWRKSL